MTEIRNLREQLVKDKRRELDSEKAKLKADHEAELKSVRAELKRYAPIGSLVSLADRGGREKEAELRSLQRQLDNAKTKPKVWIDVVVTGAHMCTFVLL